MKIQCIVEGDGDVEALPVLLRQLAPQLTAVRPWRANASKVFRGDWSEISKAVGVARRENADGVLLLLDSDCEAARCPRELAPQMQQRLEALASDLKVALVLAECEFETWFIEAAESLRGMRGLANDLERPANALIRGSKEWLGKRMPNGYRETLDQAAFAAAMDRAAASRHSRSFRKLCAAVEYLTS